MLSTWNSNLTGYPVFYVNPDSYHTKKWYIWDSQCSPLLSFHFWWLLYSKSNLKKCVEDNQVLDSPFTDALKLQGDKWQSLPKTFPLRSSLSPWLEFLQLSNHQSGACYVMWALPSEGSAGFMCESLGSQLVLVGTESITTFLHCTAEHSD